MRCVDLFRLAACCRERQHGAGDLVLRFGRQAAHLFEGPFKQLRHAPNVTVCAGDIKADGGRLIRVISARDLHRSERQRYAQEA